VVIDARPPVSPSGMCEPYRTKGGVPACRFRHMVRVGCQVYPGLTTMRCRIGFSGPG